MRSTIKRFFGAFRKPAKSSRRPLHFDELEDRRLMTVSTALLNSWFLSGQGEYSQVITGVNGGATSGPSATWSGQTTAVLGDVQKVSASTSGNYVYINTPDLASYTMGPWWSDSTKTHPFQNFPKNQNAIYRLALNTTYPSTTHGAVGGGPVALAVNGVPFFNNGDAFSYSHASAGDVMQTGDGIFNRLAEFAESATFDIGDGHQPGNGQYHYHTDPPALRTQLGDNIDYVGDTNYFPYDPVAYYLTHGEGPDGAYQQHTTNLHHSPIIGWSFDGYPIYGPYGYSNPTDPTSGIRRMVTSFSLRTDLTTGSPRVTVPGWSAALDSAKLGATAAATAANALYTMTTTQQASYAGPAVSSTYPLGRYGEDYLYTPGSGDLDQFGGRWCVTPEFPNGTYAYFDPIDASGNPVFPYTIGRQFYGTTNGGSVSSITESVTVAFDVSANTAPVVSGAIASSVNHGAALSFTGGTQFSISDVDAANTEKVVLTASAGTLNVSLSGALNSLASITAGANNSSTITLSGNIAVLNSVLATLTYTAPSTGTSATVSVQANDLSASNNLSNTVTNTVTLNNIAPTVAGPASASVVYGGTIAFSGGNAFSITDSDAISETVSLSTDAGTLSATGSGVTGNGAAALSIVGTLANVNAVLATLIFTPPVFGASATLLVQANDGSAANNLSNTVSTAIALNSNVSTPTVTSVTPFVGPTTGGNTIVVVGTGFTTASGTPVVTGSGGVKFGLASAISYTVNNATQIVAVAPAGSSIVDVTVTNVRSSSTASTADRYTYAVPTITSVTINGGAIVARDTFGNTPALAGQNSVVEQIQVTFNERVRLDADAFNITALAVATANVAAPATAGTAVVAAGVSGTGDDVDGYTQYVLTFSTKGSLNSFDNSAASGNAFTTLKDGLYSLNLVGSRAHAGVSDTAADRSDRFWTLFAATAPTDITASTSLGDGASKLLVDGVALGDMYAAFGSFSNVAGSPSYDARFDWNLDGIIDGVDLSKMYASFGSIWQF